MKPQRFEVQSWNPLQRAITPSLAAFALTCFLAGTTTAVGQVFDSGSGGVMWPGFDRH